MDPGSGRPEYEAILERSIADGLRNVLGDSGLQMVLTQYPLERISADPIVFHEAMKDIFMESGAAIIEREVARRLLDSVGNGGKLGGRSHLSWLAAASKGDVRGRVSKREKEVLRRFLALESLSTGRGPKGRGEAPTIDLTAATFAFAFKKGT